MGWPEDVLVPEALGQLLSPHFLMICLSIGRPAKAGMLLKIWLSLIRGWWDSIQLGWAACSATLISSRYQVAPRRGHSFTSSAIDKAAQYLSGLYSFPQKCFSSWNENPSRFKCFCYSLFPKGKDFGSTACIVMVAWLAKTHFCMPFKNLLLEKVCIGLRAYFSLSGGGPI